MPAKWGTKGLVKTGFNAIKFFRGKLSNVEDDIPSDYTNKDGTPKTQTKFNFIDVQILAWESPVTLEDGKLGKYVNYSNGETSPWGKLQAALEKYADRNKLEGPLPDCYYGVDLIWARLDIKSGDFVTVVYVPVDAGANFEKYSKGLVVPGSVDTEKVAEKGGSTVAVPATLDAALIELVRNTTAEGADTVQIRKAITGATPVIRKAMADAGGVDAVIAYVVAHDIVVKDGDKFVAVPAEQPASA